MVTPWLRIAHRGASGSAPELTEAAVLRALELDVDMIEIDIQLSADGEIVVVHDHELGRTVAGSGLVREHSWAHLRTLDAGSWFDSRFVDQRLLSFDELGSLVADRSRLNVEIKAPNDDWDELVPKMLATLERLGIKDSTVISCFDFGALETVRRCDSDIKIGLLWFSPDLDDAWRAVERLSASSIHPYHEITDAELCCGARERGVKVFAWTINDVDRMRSVLDAGANGIMSDFPERFALVGNGS